MYCTSGRDISGLDISGKRKVKYDIFLHLGKQRFSIAELDISGMKRVKCYGSKHRSEHQCVECEL